MWGRAGSGGYGFWAARIGATAFGFHVLSSAR